MSRFQFTILDQFSHSQIVKIWWSWNKAFIAVDNLTASNKDKERIIGP